MNCFSNCLLLFDYTIFSHDKQMRNEWSRAVSSAYSPNSTYSIINQMSANIHVKGAVRQLGTKKERLFAKSRILHEFAKRLRSVE
jgi:hypothetical protein